MTIQLPLDAPRAPLIQTERLTLGPFGAEHFDSFATFYGSERASFVGGPKDRAMAWRQLALEIGHWSLRGYGSFALTETATGKPVGYAGPWNPDGWPEPEIGWTLYEGFEGKGYATEAALAARRFAYDVLGWRTAISLVDPDNTGSAKVAERLGAHLETTITHPVTGLVQIWRHPSPEDLI